MNGQNIVDFPSFREQYLAKPILKMLKGWQVDIRKIRNYADLPIEAKAYVEFIEKSVGFKIKYISVGPEREALIIKP